MLKLVVIILVIKLLWSFFKNVVIPVQEYKALKKYNRTDTYTSYDPCNNRL